MPGGSRSRCSYSGCERPEVSKQFYTIEEGSSAGGQDWGSVVGNVLCEACYCRFRRGGTLERSLNKPLSGSARRCTYKHCDKPTEGSQFYQIKEGKSTGGQDWTSVVGSVLCKACYKRFMYKGSIGRSLNKPLQGSARRCTYKHCDSPTHGKHFYQIQEGKSTGGQDWTSVVGSVLCGACYDRFKRGGTLERSNHKRLDASERRCTYKHCDSPTHGSRFYQIKEGKSTGGQDWSSVVGNVLCGACYDRFKNKGTLERSINKRLDASERRCTYKHCDSPTHGSKFFQIQEGKSSGGQDWTSVVGSVLCGACYERFRCRGTLEHHLTHVRKKHKTSAQQSSRPSKAVPPPQALDSKHEEKEGEEEEEEEEEDDDDEAPDTGECMVCLDDSRSMCIVPCGHFGLCASCGDEGLFAGKKRPYSTCPICCEEMCEPYVMERWVWEELGGTTYDT